MRWRDRHPFLHHWFTNVALCVPFVILMKILGWPT